MKLRTSQLRALCLCTLLQVGTGCSEGIERAEFVDRSNRFGIFRDLVLVHRSPERGGSFFLDQFESTVADFASWRESLGTTATPSAPPDLRPETGVTLHQARRFAHWRFCRIPRAEEWTYVCTQGGAYPYPWGGLRLNTRANTAVLELGKLVSVGSFESGRSPVGAYDLIGNVAEWTETVDVPVEMVFPVEREVHLDMPGVDDYRLTGALNCWLPQWAPAPTDWLVQAATEDLERRVMGGSFRTVSSEQILLPSYRQPGRWDATTGVRLVADPLGLLVVLLAFDAEATSEARATLRRFLRQEANQLELRKAWARARRQVPVGGTLASLLEEELAGA